MRTGMIRSGTAVERVWRVSVAVLDVDHRGNVQSRAPADHAPMLDDNKGPERRLLGLAQRDGGSALCVVTPQDMDSIRVGTTRADNDEQRHRENGAPH